MDLVIPNKDGFGRSVIEIGEAAFNERYDLTGGLTIPNSVKTIGDFAFAHCNFEGDLIIPDSVTTIGRYAFTWCTGFNGCLIIPDSVTTIKEGAFCLCSKLTGSLTIPKSITTIEEYVFSRCRSFTGHLIIPDSVTTIGDGAFAECSGFTSLTIPDSVTSIGSAAFGKCKGLAGSLNIPDSVTRIDQNAFLDCSGFTGNLTIGNGVTWIGHGAFSGCTGFTGNLRIPDSVTGIGSKAFYNCYGFSGSLTIGNNVTQIYEQAFYLCNSFTGRLRIPDSVNEIGLGAFVPSCFETIDVLIELPDGTSTTVSKTAVYCSPNSYAWDWARYKSRVHYFEPVEWDGVIDDEAPAIVSVSIENEIISAGTPLVFSLQTKNADCVQLLFEGVAYNEYETDSNGMVNASRVIYDAMDGTREVSFRPVRGDQIGEETEIYTITVTSNGQLSAPEVVDWREEIKQGEEGVTLSWKQVPNADGYTLYLNHPDGQIEPIELTGENYKKGSGIELYGYTFPSEKIDMTGDWSVRLMAYGAGYSQSSVLQEFTAVAGEKAGSLILQGTLAMEDGSAAQNVRVVIVENTLPVSEAYSSKNGKWSISGLKADTTYDIAFYPNNADSKHMEITLGQESQDLGIIVLTSTDNVYLAVNVPAIRAEIQEDDYLVALTASEAWTARTDVEWISIQPDSGMGSAQLMIHPNTNDGIIRTGHIYIETENAKLTLPLTQMSGIMSRLDAPVITYPTEGGEAIPFSDIEVKWKPVAGAGYYVVSLRDMDTDELLISHAENGTETSTILSTTYFNENSRYRVAVGAVCEGLESTDPTTGWKECIFDVGEAEEKVYTGYFSGMIYEIVEEDAEELMARSVTEEELVSELAARGRSHQTTVPAANVKVTISKYDSVNKAEIAICETQTDYTGRWESDQLTSMPSDEYYTVLYQRDNTTFFNEYTRKPITHDGENELTPGYCVTGAVFEDASDPFAEIPNLRPHGLFAEYFEYKTEWFQFKWNPEHKRNEGTVDTVDFNWDFEHVQQNKWSNTTDYHVLKAFAYNDDSHTGASTVINYVPKKFAMRLNGYIQLKGGAEGETKPYKFRVSGDDGVRLTIQCAEYSTYEDPKEEGWKNGSNNKSTVKLGENTLWPYGRVCKITIEYYNKGGTAKLKLEYSHDTAKKDEESTWYPVPADWFYMGNRTVWITGATGIQSLYQVSMDAVNKKLDNYVDETVEGLIKDIISSYIGDPIGKAFDGFFANIGAVNNNSNTFWERIKKDALDKIKSKLTKSIYGAIAKTAAGNSDEKTLWHEIYKQLADNFKVKISDIGPEEIFDESFDVFTAYYYSSTFVEKQRSKTKDEDLLQMVDYIADLNLYSTPGVWADNVAESDRLNPTAKTETLIFASQLKDDDTVDREKLLKDVKKGDSEVNNAISLIESGQKLLKELKNNGNIGRATMSLLYRENGAGWLQALNSKNFTEATFSTQPLGQVFENIHYYLDSQRFVSIKQLETELNSIEDEKALALIARLQGVDLQMLLYKEVLRMTLDATKNYVKGLVK